MKTRLPPLRPGKAVSAARERLAAWLREWNIEQALAAKTYPAPLAPPARPRAGRCRPARAGDVRLLRPDTPTGLSRPRYFLVLHIVGARAVVVPFGRFSVPAIPGEWRTEHPAAPLAILCLWNRRELPLELVERSWPVAQFGPEQLEIANRLADDAAPPEEAPPPELAAQVGPPLRHPDDPRWRYLIEEAEAWDLLEDWRQEPARTLMIFESRAGLYGAGPAAELPLAAEPKPEFGKPSSPDKHPRGKEKPNKPA